MELLLAFVLSLGVVLVLWCLLGLLLIPVFDSAMVTLCFVQGEGDELEHRARAYGWLRDGMRCGGRLVLVDCGLNAHGLQLALLLQEKYPWVWYCPYPALTDYLELLQDNV